MNIGYRRGIACAVLAAAFYSLNAPVSKLLLGSIAPSMMASLLYLGCGLGMAAVQLLRRGGTSPDSRPLTIRELPYIIAMILLDVAAPILLMYGLTMTSPENASLLNNFEIVATSLIALVIFGERISPKLWLAIGLMTLSSMILTVPEVDSFAFSAGSVFVLLACVCWGFENNCTRVLSVCDPLTIVVIKGLFSGLGALIVALISGEAIPSPAHILPAMALGFVAYGLSILLYIYAQRTLGAARTSAYYAIAPFIGVALSLLLFRDPVTPTFLLALTLMLPATYLAQG